MTLQSILQRLRQGDRAAFAELIRHFQTPLFGYLGRMGIGQAQAEDIAQETFLRVWQHVDRYDPARAELSTWLFSIARHLAWRELEKNARCEPLHDDTVAEIAGETPLPPDALDKQQQVQRLRWALGQLTLEERSALALAYFEGFDLAAIAEIEHCSLSAVKVRLHRARQKLRQLLEENDA